MPESEAQARTKIDQALQASGWSVQPYRNFDPSASRGIALTEVSNFGSVRFEFADLTPTDVLALCYCRIQYE